MEQIDTISKPTDISRELENINFIELLVQFPELKTSQNNNRKITKRKKLGKWIFSKRVYPEKKKISEPRTQLIFFQEAMKLLFIIGQCLGLNPISGILEADVSKMRFSVFSWIFLYCATIGVTQAIITIFTMQWMSMISFSIGAIAFFAFYVSTFTTTILYLHLGSKWQDLMRELATSSLNEYIDQSLKLKCYVTCILIFVGAIVEHILSIIPNLLDIKNCLSELDMYDEFHRLSFGWYYELGLSNIKFFMVLIQIVNIISTLNWSYSDVYIICLSLYLVSILELINKKITKASERHFLPSTYWKSLREDYCKATRLVRLFDDVINGIIFASFASNLFFICLQFFNILGQGLAKASGRFEIVNDYQNITTNCHNGITFSSNVYVVYVGFSVVFILARSLTVSLIAACVHSASLMPAIALYNVPSTSFCPEVTRFLDQVHTNKVALSGWKFFYITRELVLSVAGTIVTYELVMLQVSASELYTVDSHDE